jgi:hypothetical protein
MLSPLGDSTLELGVPLGHYRPRRETGDGPTGGAGAESKQSWMSTDVARDLDTKSPSRGRGAEKFAIFAAKVLVTGACFWYLSRQIDFSQVLSAIALLDFRWAAFAPLSWCCRFRCWACVGATLGET